MEATTIRRAVRVGLVVVAALELAACMGFRRSRTDLGPEERGAAELTDLVDQWKSAAKAGDLRRSASILRELETGITYADGLTQAHPDFDDLRRVSKQAGAMQATLVKKRQAEELHAEAMDHYAKIDAALGQAAAAAKSINGAGPSEHSMRTLGTSLAELAELVADGSKEFSADADYVAKVAAIDGDTQRLRADSDRNVFVLAAVRSLEPSVASAMSAQREADSTLDLGTRAKALQRAQQGFGACVSAVEELRRASGYTNDVAVRTTLGTMPVEELFLSCSWNRINSERAAEETRWRSTVVALGTKIDDAARSVRTVGKQNRDSILTAAVGAYRSCEASPAVTNKATGFDASIKFQTTLGEFTAAGLRDNCRREAERLERELDKGRGVAASTDSRTSKGRKTRARKSRS